jgi:hypothetical protein
MNDTTRQTGGAIGVAVLGSILASKFRGTITSEGASHHLPAAVITAIKSDVGTALRVAHTPLGAPYAPTIGSISRHSFMVSFHLASMVGGAVILLAAVGVFVWLPARASDDPRPRPSHGPAGNGDRPAATTDAVEHAAPVLPGDLVPATEAERT